VLSDDQIIDEVRRAFAAQTDQIDPRPGLLGRIHHELSATPPSRRWARWPSFRADALAAALAVGVAIAIAVIALALLHHGGRAHSTPAANPVAVGTVTIAAQASDPSGGLPWALRTIQRRRLDACIQIGRLQSGQIGALGRDGAFDNDGRFHPVSPASNFQCGRTDAHGYLFLNVLEQGATASAAFGTAEGCQVEQPRRPAPGRHTPRLPTRPLCPRGDLRSIAFGVLGPDAVSVTYTLHHHTVTERTGPDGAYLAVVPGATQLCTFRSRGAESCFGGSGGAQGTTSTLQSGIITSVRYRDGHVCRLKSVTSSGVGGVACPNDGFAHYAPYHPPHITEGQVAAPMTVRTFTAKRYCYKPLAFGSFQIPCDHGVPRGYKPAGPEASRSIALVDISFTARLAADNHHSVYEFSYGRASGPANCTLNTGGTSATTMLPVRAGQRVTIQDEAEVCPGTYTGLVTYQPNGGPGRDTLDFSSPIRDRSIIVGRFTYVLRRKPNKRRG
jgi:hypothetical protein